RYVRLQAFSLHIGKALSKTKKATLSGGFPCFYNTYIIHQKHYPYPSPLDWFFVRTCASLFLSFCCF
ncbi:MAG: hypothetical protein K8953_10650, partial [Proteobacteria bacterium]|nr:hypothetical protein [Pseudomonadota bacterium]